MEIYDIIYDLDLLAYFTQFPDVFGGCER